MQAEDPDQTAVIETDEPDSTRRPWQQRRWQVAVAIGAIAALGAGALLTVRLNHDEAASVRGAMLPGGTSTPAGTAQPSDGTTSAPAASPSPGSRASTTELADGAIRTTNTGSIKKDRRTLRVVSARKDLSSEREMLWAADEGHPVGSARCTQKFRFNPQAPAGERPTMLLCWRMSPTKSVYTLLVNLDHRPSESECVGIIDREWAKL